MSSPDLNTVRTAAGRKFVAKALHPPTEMRDGDLVGVPDRDVRSSVVLETTSTFYARPPSNSVWDCVALSTNIPTAPLVFWCYAATLTRELTCAEKRISTPDPVDPFKSFAKRLTRATAAANKGTSPAEILMAALALDDDEPVVVDEAVPAKPEAPRARIMPNMNDGVVQYDTTMQRQFGLRDLEAITRTPAIFGEYRHVCKSVTAYFDAASLADQGYEMASQFTPERVEISDEDRLLTDATASPYGGYGIGDLYYLGRGSPSGDATPTLTGLPTFDTVQNLDAKSVAMRAKEGFFVVHKMSNAPTYKSATARGSFLVMGLPGATSTGMLTPFDNKGCVVPMSLEQGSDIDFCWMFFRGMSPTTSIEFKVVQAIEAIPVAGSSAVVFARPATLPDESALDALAAHMAILPAARPAAANDFADFMKTILREGAGALAGLIPGVGGVASPVARGMVDSVWNMFAGKGGARERESRAKKVKYVPGGPVNQLAGVASQLARLNNAKGGKRKPKNGKTVLLGRGGGPIANPRSKRQQKKKGKAPTRATYSHKRGDF
jgi:hypothetical protein